MPPEGGTTNVGSPAFRRNSHDGHEIPPEGGTTNKLFGEQFFVAILEELNARLAA